MRKFILFILIVLMICFSSCSSNKNNQNVITENATASTTKNGVNINKSDNSKVMNLIDNPITDINNPAYCLGKQVSVAENFFDASFICDDENWLHYGNDSVFVSCDLTSELVVGMEIELFNYDLDYLGLSLNMTYDDVCSVLKDKGYRIKTDEYKANLYFAEQTDYYTGCCTFDNIDDTLQEIIYFVNTNEISSWLACPHITYKMLETFSVIDETADGVDSEGYPIIVETVYGNDDKSLQIYFDMYSSCKKIVVNDNPNYFVFGVRTGLSEDNARQVLIRDFEYVGENVFKDNRGCVVELSVKNNIVKSIRLSFE